jgi:hypothetical protein
MEYPDAGPDDYGALAEGASWYPDALEQQAAPEAPHSETKPETIEAPVEERTS